MLVGNKKDLHMERYVTAFVNLTHCVVLGVMHVGKLPSVHEQFFFFF